MKTIWESVSLFFYNWVKRPYYNLLFWIEWEIDKRPTEIKYVQLAKITKSDIEWAKSKIEEYKKKEKVQ